MKQKLTTRKRIIVIVAIIALILMLATSIIVILKNKRKAETSVSTNVTDKKTESSIQSRDDQFSDENGDMSDAENSKADQDGENTDSDHVEDKSQQQSEEIHNGLTESGDSVTGSTGTGTPSASDQSVTSESTQVPEVTPAPEVTPEPDTSVEPDVTPEPEITPTQEPVPEVSAPTGISMLDFKSRLEGMGWTNYSDSMYYYQSSAIGVTRVESNVAYFHLIRESPEFNNNIRTCFNLLLPTKGNQLYNMATKSFENQVITMDGRTVELEQFKNSIIITISDK